MKIGIILCIIGFLLLAGSSQIAAVLSINPNTVFTTSISPSDFVVRNNAEYNFSIFITPTDPKAMNIKFRTSDPWPDVSVAFTCPGVLGPNTLLVDATKDGYGVRTVAGRLTTGEIIWPAMLLPEIGTTIEANVDEGEYFKIGTLTLTPAVMPTPTPTTTTTPTPTPTPTTTTTPVPTTPLPPTSATWFTKQNLMTAGGILLLLGLIMVAMKR